ncbi:MAG: hypothetical protein ACD_41C00100G0001 [uncultured bacterium]|nr:MAG: hypothetical protein ACD_41C00100G0001 [uncultured bacterium]
MKKMLEKLLYRLARLIIQRHQPIVIGVTGSMGKTSTKDAIATVLKKKFTVRQTPENYNNEIGMPLTIIGSTSGGRNPFVWLAIVAKALVYGLLPLNYPKVLVLEMGADKPGDIKYLTALAPANIGIVTMISDMPVHVQAFADVDHLAQEKLIMLKHLGTDDIAIANLDEPYVAAAVPSLKSKIMTISTDREADLAAFDIDYAHDPAKLAHDPTVAGLRFKMRYQGSTVPVFIPGVIGQPIVYSALYAIACGLHLEMNLVDIIAALQDYKGPNGRLRLLPGVQQSIILDDTYNSAPLAAKEALHILHELKTPGRRIAVLGVMAELGMYAKRSHAAIGRQLAQLEIDQLISVGAEGRWMGEAAIEHGYPANAVTYAETTESVVERLPTLLQPNDIVLVKGSQIARLEKVVKACLAHPETADQVLVRQHGKWPKI